MARRLMRMEALHYGARYREPGHLVLDVRSRGEHRRGHVPGSRSIPVDEVERNALRLRDSLAGFEEIYVHCSSGPRARRAYDALAAAGLRNLVLVHDSGMPDWVRHGYPVGRAPQKPLPGWLSAGLVLGALAALLWLEKRRPLRRRREDKLRHDARNLAMAAMTALTVRLAEKPLVAPLAKQVHEKARGLLPRLQLSPALETAAAVLLLDYTLYVWHVLTHKVPLLWRLHRVHHADLDLGATTALRFHFVEMLASVPWRAAQVATIGAGPLALSLWQTLTLLAILFHHSNVRLPIALERALVRVLMTPRMHGIHHSVLERERDSNWGTIFSLPDYLHRTARLDVPQRRVDIGVPALRSPEELRLGELLQMPFATLPRAAGRRIPARALPAPRASG